MNFGYLPAKTVASKFATSKLRESLSIRALSITLFAKCIFCQQFQSSYHFPTYHLLFGTSLWCFQVYIRRRCTAGKKMLLGFKPFITAPCYTLVSTSAVKDLMPCQTSSCHSTSTAMTCKQSLLPRLGELGRCCLKYASLHILNCPAPKDQIMKILVKRPAHFLGFCFGL